MPTRVTSCSTSLSDPDGINMGTIAELTLDQAEELADGLRRAAAEAREYTEDKQ